MICLIIVQLIKRNRNGFINFECDGATNLTYEEYLANKEKKNK